MRTFDLEKLESQLAGISSPKLRLLFGACASENVLPMVTKYSVANKIAIPDKLNTYLNMLWMDNDEGMSRSDLSSLNNYLEQVIAVSEEIDDEESVVANYCAEIIINTIDASTQTNNMKELAYIGRTAYTMADFLALIKIDPTGEGVNIDDAALLSNELVQSELERQDKAISFIHEIDNCKDTSQVNLIKTQLRKLSKK